MRAASWEFVWLGPEIGDLGNLAMVAKVEEAQTRLGARWPGELDPAGGVLTLADDPLYHDVPVIRKAFHVEPDVSLPAADLLPGPRTALDDIVGQRCGKRIPVPGLRRGPVGRDRFVRIGHIGQASRQVGHSGELVRPGSAS
jgi:hypothetical protein